MKKFIQIIIFTFIYLILNIFQSFADEKIKIGLIVPLSGEYKEIGNSIVKSARLAINKIDDSRIEIIPRDTKSNPETTLKVSYTKPTIEANDSELDAGTYIHKGIAKRSFDLGWKISPKFDLTKITAKMENGLLTIEVPVTPESRPKTITIK